jgi:hypothetical protein
LSSEPHDGHIHDPVLHYLGCIEFCERESFFEISNPLWQSGIDFEARRLKPDDRRFELDDSSLESDDRGLEPDKRSLELDDRNVKSDDKTLENATTVVERRVRQWSWACKSELDRIRSLRNALADDGLQVHFVKMVTESRLEWTHSETYSKGLESVRSWRDSVGRPTTQPNDKSGNDNGDKDTTPRMSTFESTQNYNPDENSIAHIIRFTENEPPNDEAGRSTSSMPQGSCSAETTSVESLLNLAGMNNGSFRHLFSKDQSLNGMKYVHFPANNMTVSKVNTSHLHAEALTMDTFSVGRGMHCLNYMFCQFNRTS